MSPEFSDARSALNVIKPEQCDCAGADRLAGQLGEAVSNDEVSLEQALLFYAEAMDTDCAGKRLRTEAEKAAFTGCGADEKVCGHPKGAQFLGNLITKIQADGLPLIDYRDIVE